MNDLESALVNFMTSFEMVFDEDWEYTMLTMGMEDSLSDYVIADFYTKGGTFLNPKVPDESNNWFHRGWLLAAHRKLIHEMEKSGYDLNIFNEDE